MPIIRAQNREKFLVLDCKILNNKELSWKAKAILAYMLSMPDDWIFYIDELAKHSTDGRDALKSGLKELQMAGHIVRKQKRNSDGTLGFCETFVYEVPIHHINNPLMEKQLAEKPSTDNPQLLNINSTKYLTEPNNKEIIYSVVDYLNRKTGKNFSSKKKETIKLIEVRIDEGHTLDDFKKVIDIKTAEWLNNESNKYLRPDTLFGPKFEAYLNQKEPPERNIGLDPYDDFPM